MSNQKARHSDDGIVDLFSRFRRGGPVWRFPHGNEELRLDALLERAASAAEVLTQLGLGPGERVALSLGNGPECVSALFAIWQVGAVAVPLRPNVGEASGYGQYLKCVDELCKLRFVIVERGIEFAGGSESLESKVVDVKNVVLGSAAPSTRRMVRAARDEPALLQLTSGSTSDPRAVIVTHGMVMDQLAYLSDSSRYYAGHKVASAASWLPIHHDMGLFTGILWPLYDGADNLLTSPFFYMRNPVRWFRLLSEYRVDMNFATNTSAAAACKAMARGRYVEDLDLSNLQLYFGAEKLHVEVLERVERTFAPFGLMPEQIHVGYGMAENALAATRSPRGRVRRVEAVISADGTVSLESGARNAKLQTFISVGAAFPGYTLQIRQLTTNAELPDLSVGEVCLAGPCLTPGYFGDDDSTMARLRGGFLRTGDLGFVYQNELYFVGREDDIVNLGGRKVVPDDVEHVVEALSFVGTARSCFLGMAEQGVTTPLLLVEAADNLTSEQEQERVAVLRRVLLDDLDLLVGRIVFCRKDTVERTSSGKKRRKVIRDRYLNGEIKLLRKDVGLESISQPL